MPELAILGVLFALVAGGLALVAIWLAWFRRDAIPALILASLSLTATFVSLCATLAGRIMA